MQQENSVKFLNEFRLRFKLLYYILFFRGKKFHFLLEMSYI